MPTLATLTTRYTVQERGVANLLPEEAVLAQLLVAVGFYLGFANLDDTARPLGGDTVLSDSEWALIRPLFLLYVERETALQLEATRGLGAEPFGRSSAEVAGEITAYEGQLPKLAFFHPVVSV